MNNLIIDMVLMDIPHTNQKRLVSVLLQNLSQKVMY